jgi:hypothetical protein
MVHFAAAGSTSWAAEEKNQSVLGMLRIEKPNSKNNKKLSPSLRQPSTIQFGPMRDHEW